MLAEKKLNPFERKTAVWPAYAGCIWALLYAVFVRFYHAAGGRIGMAGQLQNPEGFYMASYIAGVVIMLCGFVLIALVKPWGIVLPSWIPLIGGTKIPRLVVLLPTLACTAFLMAHGVSGIVTKALFLGGFITMHFTGWSVLDSHSLALWDLLFYEPWFLIMGGLSGLTASHYAQATGGSLAAWRRNTIYYLIAVFLLSALFVYKIIDQFAS